MQASRLNALLASAECLVSADTMNAAYDALAVQIEQDWVSEIQDQVPLVLVVMSICLLRLSGGGVGGTGNATLRKS